MVTGTGITSALMSRIFNGFTRPRYPRIRGARFNPRATFRISRWGVPFSAGLDGSPHAFTVAWPNSPFFVGVTYLWSHSHIKWVQPGVTSDYLGSPTLRRDLCRCLTRYRRRRRHHDHHVSSGELNVGFLLRPRRNHILAEIPIGVI